MEKEYLKLLTGIIIIHNYIYRLWSQSFSVIIIITPCMVGISYRIFASDMLISFPIKVSREVNFFSGCSGRSLKRSLFCFLLIYRFVDAMVQQNTFCVTCVRKLVNRPWKISLSLIHICSQVEDAMHETFWCHFTSVNIDDRALTSSVCWGICRFK